MSTALNFPIPEVRSAITNGLQDALDVIHQVAVNRAPKETGFLRNDSGTLVEGNEGVVHFDAPYAVRQHEEVGWNHQDGEAKYLENAVIATRSTVEAVLAEALRKAAQ